MKSDGTPDRSQETLAQFKERANAQKAAMGMSNTTSPAVRAGVGIPNMQGTEMSELGVPIVTTPGRQLGAAAGANADRQTRTTSGTSAPTTLNTATTAASGSDLGQIIVHVEGYCIDCGDKMKGTTQRTQVNPATR